MKDHAPLFVAASVGGFGLWLLVALSESLAASALLLVLVLPILSLAAAAPVAVVVAPLWFASQRFGLRSATLFAIGLGLFGAVGYAMLSVSVAPSEQVSLGGLLIASAWVAAVSFAYSHLKGHALRNDG